MPSPEHGLHRPCTVFAPENKTGRDESGQTEVEQQQAYYTQPGGEQSNNSIDQPHGIPDEVELERVRSSENRQFIWSEDLSDNGQKLYLLLLGDIGFKKHLPELAQIEGIDLDTGLDELRSYGILDESDPNIILLVTS